MSRRTRSLFQALAAFSVILISLTSALATTRERILYTFQGVPHGAHPADPTLAAFAVSLIPLTSALAPSPERILYPSQGVPDGPTPAAPLVADAKGNFYG